MKSFFTSIFVFFISGLFASAEGPDSDTVFYYIAGSGVGISTDHEVVVLDSANIFTLMWQEDSTVAIQLQGMNGYGFDGDNELWNESLLLSNDDSLRAILRIILLITNGDLVDLIDLEGLPLGYKGIRAEWISETNGIEVKNNYSILLNDNYALFITLTAFEDTPFSTLNQRALSLFSQLQFGAP